MTLEEERRYIALVLSGDGNAFEALVLDNQKKVYNLALKMTGNEQDALDVSQEAFFNAYRSLSDFRGESRFSVWLYRLTYNLCIDLLRKNSRAPTLSLTVTEEDGTPAEIQLSDLRALPDEVVEREELVRAVRRGIETLPELHRTVLLLREDGGLSYADIAATLDISEGTVKSRIARARQALTAKLIEDGTFSASPRQKDRRGAK